MALDNQYLNQCIEDCLACYQECLGCIPHCLALGGEHAEQKHITLLMECAQICQLSASVMKLKGSFAFEHCQVCAQVCDACAESCNNIDAKDEVMRNCAEMCRQCASSCRNMGKYTEEPYQSSYEG